MNPFSVGLYYGNNIYSSLEPGLSYARYYVGRKQKMKIKINFIVEKKALFSHPKRVLAWNCLFRFSSFNSMHCVKGMFGTL